MRMFQKLSRSRNVALPHQLLKRPDHWGLRTFRVYKDMTNLSNGITMGQPVTHESYYTIVLIESQSLCRNIESKRSGERTYSGKKASLVPHPCSSVFQKS